MKESTVPVTQQEKAPSTRDETRTLIPPVDIFEYEDGLGVIVDLPGVGKNDADIRVEDNVLTIDATPKFGTKGTPLHREFELTRYFRQFDLSEEIDSEKIEAEMKHGVLTLRLPKSEKSKPKKIEISVS